MKFENYCMIEFLKEYDINLTDKYFKKVYNEMVYEWYSKWSNRKSVINFYSNHGGVKTLQELDPIAARDQKLNELLK